MEIYLLNLQRLRNEEHFQFQTDFKGLVDRFTPVSLKVEAAFSTYQPLYNDESIALELIRKSAVTEEIANADTLRDSTFRGMCDAVKSAKNHFNPAVRQAASRVQLLLDHYGNVSIRAYAEETAAINSLITDLGANAADVTTLAIADWIAELLSNNITFNTLMKTRYTEEAGKTQLRMKQVRVKVDEAYRVITNRINALIIVNGESAYSEFVTELNLRIDKYNLHITKRKGRNDKGDEPQEPTN